MDESSLQLELESPSDVTRTVKGEIAWEPVKEKLDEAYDELGKSVTLKGFRKGKVPRSLLAKMFHSRIAGEIAHNLVQEALVEAVKRLDLQPVLPIHHWDITEGAVTKGQPLTFEATLEVMPEVEVQVYDGLEISRREPQITDEQVDKLLEMKQEELTQFVPVEGVPIAAGHIVHSNVMGKVGDRPLSYENLVFLMPEEGEPGPARQDPEETALVAALVELLRGKPSDPGEHDLEHPFDEDAPEAWRGKTAKLLVEITSVTERQVPEIGDDLAQESGEADTLEEYREVLRKQLMESEEKTIRQEMGDQITDKLIEANPIEITPTLVEKQLNSVMQRARFAFQMRGVSLDDLGMDDDSLRDQFRGSAEKEVKRTLLADAIARKENIDVSEEDVTARLTEIAEARGESLARIRAEYERDGGVEALRAVMREEKVIDLLLDRAHVKPVSETSAPDEDGASDGASGDKADSTTQEPPAAETETERAPEPEDT